MRGAGRARWVGDGAPTLQPIGPMSRGCCDTLLAEARALAYPLKLLSVAQDFIEGHRELCAHFDAQ